MSKRGGCTTARLSPPILSSPSSEKVPGDVSGFQFNWAGAMSPVAMELTRADHMIHSRHNVRRNQTHKPRTAARLN